MYNKKYIASEVLTLLRWILLDIATAAVLEPIDSLEPSFEDEHNIILV